MFLSVVFVSFFLGMCVGGMGRREFFLEILFYYGISFFVFFVMEGVCFLVFCYISRLFCKYDLCYKFIGF